MTTQNITEAEFLANIDAIITAIASQKGGTGKSLLAAQLANAAARRRRRVLIGDLDPQGNSTSHFTPFGPDEHEPKPENSLADTFDKKIALPISDVIIPSQRPGVVPEHREGIDIAPAGYDELQGVMDGLQGSMGADARLQIALQKSTLRKDYDHILFDCRPFTDLVTRNGLYAADQLLMVTEPARDAIDGFKGTLRSVDDLRDFLGKDLPLVGVVINKYDMRIKSHGMYAAALEEYCAASDIPVLGRIPLNADLMALTESGMGTDEHPRPTSRLRYIQSIFDEILDAVEARALVAA